MHLSRYRLIVGLLISVVITTNTTAQIAMPIDGFESVGLAYSILEHHTSGALYLPSVLHGLLESTDDGRTWNAVDPKATFGYYKQGNTLLWENDTTMYARCVDGFGFVYQLTSTDYGRTWQPRPVHKSGTKFMTTLIDGTAVDEYRFDVSTDFGTTWKKVPATYDSVVFHSPAILVAPHTAAVWDSRGNWYEVDCVNDTAVRKRMTDRSIYSYRRFSDGSVIAVGFDSWRWYSSSDSLVRKTTDTVIDGKTISLAGSRIVTTGKSWFIVTRSGCVFALGTTDITYLGQPSKSAVRQVKSVDVRDNRLIISSNMGSGLDEVFEMAEYDVTSRTFRIVVTAREDMIGSIVHLSTVTRAGTPVVLTKVATILRYEVSSGDWKNADVTPLSVPPQPLTVIGAIPAERTPGFALVTSTLQPYRVVAPSEFVVDTTRLPEGSFVLRSVGHTLRTTCHRMITTPGYFWHNGYDMKGTSRLTGKDTTLCRECHAYLESSAGLTFSGTRKILRKHAMYPLWDTLTIDPYTTIEKTGYVSDIVESTIHNTVVASLRGYRVDTDSGIVDSVRGGLYWTNDLGTNWYFSELPVSLPYVHSMTRVGPVIYAVASNAIFHPQDVGPDKDVGAMIVDSVAILRSTDGGYTFNLAHVVHMRRSMHMHDMRVIEHGGRLYTCLQDHRIWVSDNGVRWEEDADQPQPQGSVLSLTGIGDSIMILATTRGAFILEKNIQVDVETPAWQPLTAMYYTAATNCISLTEVLGTGTLIVSDVHGRIVMRETIDAQSRRIQLPEIPSGTYTAVFVTPTQAYPLVFGRLR